MYLASLSENDLDKMDDIWKVNSYFISRLTLRLN